MYSEPTELETLVGKLRSLIELLNRDQPVLEADLELSANQVYTYSVLHALYPLSPMQLSGLVQLATAPEHPKLTRIRERAIGAQDMYARLATPAWKIAAQPPAGDSANSVTAPAMQVTPPAPLPATSASIHTPLDRELAMVSATTAPTSAPVPDAADGDDMELSIFSGPSDDM